MAITQTGATQIFNIANTNTGTVSSTITVPADAKIAVVFVTGYGSGAGGTTNFYSTGSMTFTKGGSQVAMTNITTEGDTNTSAFMVSGFYLAGIDTGANKTLNWDWLGSGASFNTPIVALLFFTGIDTASPVRDGGGGQATGGTPYTSSTLTAQTGDFIVAAAGGFPGGSEGSINWWSNLTLLQQTTFWNGTDMALAANSAPTGNMTVAASTATNWVDGGIVALVLTPAAPTYPNIYFGCGQV